MSKGLEELLNPYGVNLPCSKEQECEYTYTETQKIIIEKELKRLEWYDNLGKPTSGVQPKKQDYRLNQLLNSFEYIDQENIRSLCQKRYEEIVDIIDENEINKKALEILSEHIIINEKNGYVEFSCDFSLPTNSKYENEEHFKEKIDLLKEVLL